MYSSQWNIREYFQFGSFNQFSDKIFFKYFIALPMETVEHWVNSAKARLPMKM